MTQTLTRTTPSNQIRFGLKPQGRWTYEDWLNFPDDGYKYEVIDGVLHIMPPPAILHQIASLNLAAAMNGHAKTHKLGRVLTAPCAVRLPQQDVPLEPDIFFVKQANLDTLKKTRVEGVPDLVVEVLSPSNENYDRETKFTLYQANGVSEYWLVNYWEKTVTVFVLVEGLYPQEAKYTLQDTVQSIQLVGFSIPVHEIFEV